MVWGESLFLIEDFGRIVLESFDFGGYFLMVKVIIIVRVKKFLKIYCFIFYRREVYLWFRFFEVFFWSGDVFILYL